MFLVCSLHFLLTFFEQQIIGTHAMFGLPFLRFPLVLSYTGAHPGIPLVGPMVGARAAIGVKPSGKALWIVSEVWVIPALTVE